MSSVPTRSTITIGVVAALALAAASTLALGTSSRAFDGSNRLFNFGRHRTAISCNVPTLDGTLVDVTLMNMGGPMMMGHRTSVTGGMMRLVADRTTVAAGTVSFLAVNGGSVNHELAILPLPEGQIVGSRPVGNDGKIDERGSLGEASNTCGAGAGDGIAPGTAGWVTVTLQPGRYEIVCDLPGHYAAGMYGQLTVQ